MPFGENGEHVTVRLIDFDDLEQQPVRRHDQFTFRAGADREALRPRAAGQRHPAGRRSRRRRPASRESRWLDGAAPGPRRLRAATSRSSSSPNVSRFATEGKELRYGSIGMPVELWGPWRAEDDADARQPRSGVEQAVSVAARAGRRARHPALTSPLYATDKKHRKIKIIARYQQYEATNQIVERVVAGRIRRRA